MLFLSISVLRLSNNSVVLVSAPSFAPYCTIKLENEQLNTQEYLQGVQECVTVPCTIPTNQVGRFLSIMSMQALISSSASSSIPPLGRLLQL